LLLIAGEVETLPRVEQANLEEERKQQAVERRITRRQAREGVVANTRQMTDEDKSLRAIRRRPADRGPYLS
jgi:hypothetical protein